MKDNELMDNPNLRKQVYDITTGEILIDEKFKPTSYKKIAKKREFAIKHEEEESFMSLQKEICGDFVYFIYDNMDMLNEILEPQELTRFIYLGTYCDRDGYLKSGSRYIIKNDIIDGLLYLSVNKARDCLNKLCDLELIEITEDDKVKVNYDFFHRGNKSDYKLLTNKHIDKFVKLYIDAIRTIYRNVSIKQHKQLSVIFKLLPYINYKHNVICRNVNEQDKNKIDAMQIHEIAKMLGYCERNITQFRKMLYGITYKEKKVFMICDTDVLDKYIYINPTILYKDTDLNAFQYLLDMFDIKKRI
jgi:hypothetical protein